MDKKRVIILVLLLVLLVVLSGCEKKKTPGEKPEKPTEIVKSDDYYGYSHGARRVYDVVIEVKGEDEKTFHGTSEMTYEVIIDDPGKLTVIKETDRFCGDGEDPSVEFKYNRKEKSK